MGRIDQFLKAYYKDDAPGGVVAVISKGKIIYIKAFGMAVAISARLSIPRIDRRPARK